MRLTPVEMVGPVWIDSICLCVNAHLATVVPSVTQTYVCNNLFLAAYRLIRTDLKIFKNF